MNALLIVVCAAAGLVAGTWVGFWVGERQGCDFDFSVLVYGLFGGMVGCLIGTAIGAVLFT